MKIEIWSDIACPWCYVGKRRFERALAEFEHRDDVEVLWRSFQLDPSAPRQQTVPQAELLARKYRVPLAQAQAMNARVAAEGAKDGLALRFDRVRPANTFDAHRLIHFAATRERRAAMVERLFAAYFTEGEPLGDVDTLARLAGDVGVPSDEARAVLASDQFADAVRDDQARARSLGIDGVPFFVLAERYGLSGAQPAELHLEALRQAWGERDAAPAAPAEGCEDESCLT
jgi:predicted DsbA family dithiol-disulfide isomerase